MGLALFGMSFAACSEGLATRPSERPVQATSTERRVDVGGGSNGVCGDDCPDVTLTLVAADGSTLVAECTIICHTSSGTLRFAGAAGADGSVHVDNPERLDFALHFHAPGLGAQGFLIRGDLPASTVTVPDDGCESGLRTTMTAQGAVEMLGMTSATATFCVVEAN